MLERDRGVVRVVFRWSMDDRERRIPDYYREKAEEIRRVARQACSPEVIRELFETADRFDRMAAHVERRHRNAAV